MDTCPVAADYDGFGLRRPRTRRIFIYITYGLTKTRDDTHVYAL